MGQKVKERSTTAEVGLSGANTAGIIQNVGQSNNNGQLRLYFEVFHKWQSGLLRSETIMLERVGV